MQKIALPRLSPERLAIGVKRLVSVLGRERVAAIRTLEMKISDAGPPDLRVEPHILGLAGIEATARGLVTAHRHPDTKTHNWFAPAVIKPASFRPKLDELAGIYRETTDARFTAGLGDPLEITVFKILLSMREVDRRVTFFGSFNLSGRNLSDRYSKTEPPIAVNAARLDGPPDFVLHHPDTGEALIIECKNVREWIYPSSDLMKTLVAKALAVDMTPVLIARRLPYITKAALCAPAGIIAHETYNQLYPDTPVGRALAAKVRVTRGMGYADVRATETPLPRTERFFHELLPQILPDAVAKFQAAKPALQQWVAGAMTWTQLRQTLVGGYDEPDAGMDF